MSKFSFLHVHPSFGCYVGSMDVITLRGCLYNGVSINLTHTAIDQLTGFVNICMGGWSSWYIIHHTR